MAWGERKQQCGGEAMATQLRGNSGHTLWPGWGTEQETVVWLGERGNSGCSLRGERKQQAGGWDGASTAGGHPIPAETGGSAAPHFLWKGRGRKREVMLCPSSPFLHPSTKKFLGMALNKASTDISLTKNKTFILIILENRNFCLRHTSRIGIRQFPVRQYDLNMPFILFFPSEVDL